MMSRTKTHLGIDDDGVGPREDGIFAEAPGGTNMNLVIEPNAIFKTNFFFDEINYTTRFIADSSGFTEVQANSVFLRGGTLEIGRGGGGFEETMHEKLFAVAAGSEDGTRSTALCFTQAGGSARSD